MRLVLLILACVFGVFAAITLARHENEVQIVAAIVYVGFAVVFIALRAILIGIHKPAEKQAGPPLEQRANFWE